jgi:LysM repeat protein
MTLTTITRKLSRTLLVGVVASGLVVAFCLSASAAEGGVGGRPAHPRDDNPRSKSIFVHELEPGKQVTDGIQVVNNSSITKQVLVYAVDSQMSSGGAFACAQAADKPIAAGTWIELEKDTLTLEPGENTVVDFKIKVPEEASPGEHNGCIVVQDTDRQRAPGGSGITLSMRSAIRLAVTVPGDIQKGLVVTGLGIEPRDDQRILMSTGLKNNGNVSLDAQLGVTLRYWFGTTATSVGGTFPVMSGSEARFNFEGGRPFWGGWYRLSATARYNSQPDVSVGEGKPNASVTRSEWVFVAPQPLAAAVEGAVIVVLLAGLGYVVRTRLVHKKAMRHSAKHTVEPHENLHTIAEMYNVPWKLLARINSLKPPYQLKTGQVITVTKAKTHRPKAKSNN